jgi:hypothetical protein
MVHPWGVIRTKRPIDLASHLVLPSPLASLVVTHGSIRALAVQGKNKV